MTTAHTSCHWPAVAWFAEHGQHAGDCPMLGNMAIVLQMTKQGMFKMMAKRYALIHILRIRML